MGIDTGSKLILGLSGEDIMAQATPELRDEINATGFYEVLGEDGRLGLERASPYYDADYEQCIWGVGLGGDYWRGVEIDPATLPQKILDAQAKFTELTGLVGKLYVSSHVI